MEQRRQRRAMLAFIAVGMMILRSVSRPLGGDPAQAGAAVASMADGRTINPCRCARALNAA